MNLDIILRAVAQGRESIVQLEGALEAVKLQADSTGRSLDDVKVHSSAAAEGSKLLSTAQVDVKTRMEEARKRAEELTTTLKAHGVATDDAEKASTRFMASLAKQAVISDLSKVVRDSGESMRVLGSAVRSTADSLVQAEMPTANATSSFDMLKDVGSKAGGVFSQIGSAVMPALIYSIIQVAVAAAPMLFALGSWLIVTVALTVGLLAFVAVVGLAALAVGGLGMAIIALGVAEVGGLDPAGNLTTAQNNLKSATAAHESAVWSLQQAEASAIATRKPTPGQLHAIAVAQDNVKQTTDALTKAQQELTKAQQVADSPFGQLINHFNKMKDTLSQGAVPLLNQLSAAADQLIAPIQALGLDLEKWFGDHLPGILAGAGRDFEILGFWGGKLGDALKPLFDWIANHESTIEDFFNLFAGLGVQAIQGLIVNLLRLSDWFLAEWPTLSPIAAQGFDLLGSAIQGLGPIFAQITDWIKANWPTIARLAKESADAFGIVLTVVGVLWDVFINSLGPAFAQMAAHSTEAKIVLIALASPLIIAAALVFLLVNVILGFILNLISLIVWIGEAVTWLKVHLPEALKWAGDRFSDLSTAVNAAVTWMGQRFSDLSSWAGSMSEGIGAAFSTIGTRIHDGLQSARTVLVNFIKMADDIPIIGGILNAEGFNAGNVPGFAQGGIVSKPTLGVFGEAGPEALIPLGGGSRAIDLWHQAGQALGQLGAGPDMSPGTVGGQCVIFVQNMTGVHFPVEFASQMSAWVNDFSQAAGTVGVSTIPPYGHTWINLGGGMVIDSNWVGNEIIGIHPLSDIPALAGDISGLALHGLPSAAMGLLDISGSLKKQIAKAMGGLGGWAGAIAQGLLEKVIPGLAKRFDSGGWLMPGMLGFNGTSSPERVLSPGESARGEIVLHTHVHIGDEVLATIVERISANQLSNLLTTA